MKSLKDKQLVSSKQHNLLDHNLVVFQNACLKTIWKILSLKDKHSYCYNLETKQFAMALHYYSQKAYEIVHNVFFLPHLSTIRSWAASIDCEPSFFCDIRWIGKVAKMKPYMSDAILIVV